MTVGLYKSKKHILSLGILREPILKFLAFSENDLYLIAQIFSEKDNSVLEHATEMRSGSY